MDEILLKQLVRQLKWLNFWVTFFGVLFVATFVVSGVFLFKAVTYIHSSEQKITNLQTKASQTLDVQDKACSNSELKSLATQAGLCD